MFETLKKTFLGKNFLSEPKISEKKQVSSYPAEVLEIHNEFNTAADKLLEEANQLLKEGEKKDFEKVDRLKSLGFVKANQVAELEPIRQKIELTKEQVELINYYKVQYPFNKFITTDQIESICKKYGLVYGDVSLYKGFVPEKNLKEIESFKLKNKEKNCLICSNGLILEDAEIRKAHYNNDSNYYHIYKKGTNSFSFQSENGVDFYGTFRDNPFNLKDVSVRNFTIKNNNLKICAPFKDMDTTGMKLTQGFKLEKEIPDPVVLQAVKGGALILTMWADEQFDPFTEPILRNDELNN